MLAARAARCARSAAPGATSSAEGGRRPGTSLLSVDRARWIASSATSDDGMGSLPLRWPRPERTKPRSTTRPPATTKASSTWSRCGLRRPSNPILSQYLISNPIAKAPKLMRWPNYTETALQGLQLFVQGLPAGERRQGARSFTAWRCLELVGPIALGEHVSPSQYVAAQVALLCGCQVGAYVGGEGQ